MKIICETAEESILVNDAKKRYYEKTNFKHTLSNSQIALLALREYQQHGKTWKSTGTESKRE